MGATYRYELRRGAQIVATGHLAEDVPLEVGDEITLGRTRGIVREIGPKLPGGELRLVVRLAPDSPEQWTPDDPD